MNPFECEACGGSGDSTGTGWCDECNGTGLLEIVPGGIVPFDPCAVDEIEVATDGQ
ncbi:hypothetical protein [Nocardia brasiliensis]|uniref:hypothetical protein n=1 Tax=Nocardia brasiliensis TaxID=37326 RepID=UPI000B19CBE5|nr:hypothetical protein [Nocardia brasiliensis]